MKPIRDINRPLGDTQLAAVLDALGAGEELPGDPGVILWRLARNYRDEEQRIEGLEQACQSYMDMIKDLRAEIRTLSNDRLAEFFAAAMTGILASPGVWRIKEKPVNDAPKYSDIAMEIAQAMLKKFKAEAG